LKRDPRRCQHAGSFFTDRNPDQQKKAEALLADAVLASVALQGRYDAVAIFDDKLRKKLKKQSTASYWSD
jgi:hypothetical protein